MTGKITILDDTNSEQFEAELPEVNIDKNVLPLKSVDIYKDLGLRGYDYKGLFKGVKESDSKGEIWNTNKQINMEGNIIYS